MAKASIVSCPMTVVFLFILHILAVATPSFSDNQTDSLALLAFKKSILDDPHGALSSWNQATHFCSWNGVSCGARHPDRVVSLHLRSQGLVGSLSPHTGNLSFLRIIDLKNNSFQGQIPEEMGRLGRLEIIHFSNNSFQGGIPRNLSRCTKLTYLNLIDNHLEGPIIPEIRFLVNLETLFLTSNMLSGTIPEFLGNMTNLARISLADCGLRGVIPDSIAKLPAIRYLSLNWNSLTGRIPFGLFNQSKMEHFSVRSNQLHGTIPSDMFFKLPMLNDLDLGYNHFTGPFPTSLSNSSQMEYLAFAFNNFSGEMIDAGRISTLLYVDASSNHLKGDIDPILSSLTNCTSLQILALYYNLLHGSLPDSIGNLSRSLWYLSIAENQLSGSIPSSVENLIGLKFFIFEFNSLVGSLPSSIGNLPRLQSVYLRENRLTNEIPSSLGNLTFLAVLELSQNDFFGNIPRSLCNCTSFIRLDLSLNNLNGSIPPEISRLSTISVLLNLSYNALVGTIPPEVGTLRNLGALDLSHNRLSGLVPSTLSSCVMLETLRLESNSLQGEIPDSLRALKGLQDLDLSRNNFSGTIPSFLGELHLSHLNLSFNALRGEVPNMGVFQNESAISLEGNHELCGGLAVLNLPSCSSTSSKNKDFRKIWIPAAGAIFFALSVCFFVITFRRRRSDKVRKTTSISGMHEFLRLSYEDLVNATGGFSEMNLLGAGKFGSVYKGIINDEQKTYVAVKVLNLNVRGAYKSFASECNALRGIRHRNLLKILSICDSLDFQGEDLKALVYEYMPNGSLENWLHQNSEEEGGILTTLQRLNIAIDIASAVEYLHCGTETTIIHGDLKASNILLDEDMVAHVGDFGLAKVISRNTASSNGSSSGAIKGTIGYIAPEYGLNNAVSTQGDAYSYGILLLEMFTNKRPTSDAFGVRASLQDFVSSALPDRVTEAVDPFLHQELRNNDEYRGCIVSILSIGVRCSKEIPRDRMSMAQVVNELDKIRNVVIGYTKVVSYK